MWNQLYFVLLMRKNINARVKKHSFPLLIPLEWEYANIQENYKAQPADRRGKRIKIGGANRNYCFVG
jgi:hypothetical protein